MTSISIKILNYPIPIVREFKDKPGEAFRKTCRRFLLEGIEDPLEDGWVYYPPSMIEYVRIFNDLPVEDEASEPEEGNDEEKKELPLDPEIPEARPPGTPISGVSENDTTVVSFPEED